MDLANATAFGTLAGLIIASISTATVKIIRAIKKDTNVTIAGQQAGIARGKVRDKKVKEIHILSNSRYTDALRLITVMARKEADRTGKEEDINFYQEAMGKLKFSEDANNKIINPDIDEDEVKAREAESKLVKITNGII